MSKPSLLVLAAGMGSRYGGLKQLDEVGPNGETILDYSITDAIRAGFGKVVFVIRHSFEKAFRQRFTEARFGNKIQFDFAFQELDYLPEGYSLPEGREKPWGTNHAVLMGAEKIFTPFAVVNADDFYGKDAYYVMAEYLRNIEGKEGEYAMVGYRLENTLSDFGTVSRGECVVDKDNFLVSITERTSISRTSNGVIEFIDNNGGKHPLAPETPVSMNFFGFTPDYFKKSEQGFRQFLGKNINVPKSEFYIPSMVNQLLVDGSARMKVLSSSAQWFGVTYKEDKPYVIKKIAGLIAAGEY